MIHPGKGLVEGFLDDYRTGRHGSSREPAWRLREFTLKLGLTGDRIGDGELFAVACNALVAHFDGTLIQGVNKQPAGVVLFRSLLGKGGA
jgi:hypothetical protein